MAMRGGEAPVGSDQRRRKQLRESYVDCVIRRQGIPKLPGSLQQRGVRIPVKRQREKAVEGVFPFFRLDGP
jgi:hypothetical protein